MYSKRKCTVKESCSLEDAQVKITHYKPKPYLGSCDEELALTYFDRAFRADLIKKYRAVKDYGFDIQKRKQLIKANLITITSKNKFVGSNHLNLYTSESKISTVNQNVWC